MKSVIRREVKSEETKPKQAIESPADEVPLVNGWRHSAALTVEGRLWTFGWSKYGRDVHSSKLPLVLNAPFTQMLYLSLTTTVVTRIRA